MTTIKIEAGALLASAVDLSTREIPFTALRYGEQGRTNLGRITVDRGAFSLPVDVENTMGVNLEHDPLHPLGRVVELRASEHTIDGRLRIAGGPEGDALLAAYAADDPDAPRSVSVEVRDIVLRAGRAVAGVLTGLAICKAGAFPSSALLAADVGDEVADAADAATTTEHDENTFTDENGVTWSRVADTETTVEDNKTTTTTTVVEEIQEPTDASDTEEEEDVVTTATAPSTLTARRAQTQSTRTPDKKPDQPAGLSFKQMMTGLAAIKSGTATPQLLATLVAQAGPSRNALFAALTDIPYQGVDAPGTVMNPNPQWLGELWDGLTYIRDAVDVVNTGELTALTLAGWKWDEKPGGAGYLGNKRNIPSKPAKLVPVEVDAEGWAGGNDHDIRYKHFPNAAYWESYYQVMRESYAIWSNEKCFNTLALNAQHFVPDAVPGNLAAGLSYLVDGVAEVIENKAIPTFAFVETALYKGILKTTNNNVLGYLDAAIGLEKGTLESAGFQLKPRSTYSTFAWAGATPNEAETRTEHPFTGVLVGARQAATFHELPGVPVRSEAEDIARGGLDTGLFGYAATVLHKADALAHIGAAPLDDGEA